MALTIQTNVSALTAQKNLGANQRMLAGSFQKLSSGFRVNTAADDAAGLAVSESMKSQIRSYTVGERNAADGISMAQTAEGALGQVHDVLGRMRELAMQSSNGSMTSTDRTNLDTEFSSLKAEIGRIQDSAKFNGKQLVAVSGETIKFQVGLNATASDQISVTFGGVNLSALLATGSSVADVSGAQAALGNIDTSIQSVSNSRAKFGTAMNRLEIATSNIQTMRLNLSAANSRIVDVDVATETAAMSRNQVLSQAGVSVLAQANQLPQLAFGLLR
jgi:flagellin